MRSRKFLRFTGALVYGGTALVSVLSFFTTLYGLAIIVDFPLAVIGSLGLQAAMLGIAWNLIGLKENRLLYISVFCVTASFSVFFSYVNFDVNLRLDTRALDSRRQFATDSRSALDLRSRLAEDAAVQGRYQLDRLNDLIVLEQTEGWATLVDEGSKDPFVQSVIDGARLTVDSWSERKGRSYIQGSGRGLIINYLESRRNQAQSNLARISDYAAAIDSLTMSLSGELAIEEQYPLVNRAATEFPASEISLILGQRMQSPPPPPDPGRYVEKAETPQHALSLALDDLFAFDRTSVFALLMALAIDLITLLIALAGSKTLMDYDITRGVVDRVGDYAANRLKRVSLLNLDTLQKELEENIKRFEAATKYSETVKSLRNTLDPDNPARKTTITRNAETLQQETSVHTSE